MVRARLREVGEEMFFNSGLRIILATYQFSQRLYRLTTCVRPTLGAEEGIDIVYSKD